MMATSKHGYYANVTNGCGKDTTVEDGMRVILGDARIHVEEAFILQQSPITTFDVLPIRDNVFVLLTVRKFSDQGIAPRGHQG